MNVRTAVATTLTLAFAATTLIAMPGCAVTRGQETVGAYVDDTAITTAVKARMAEDKTVDMLAISVETLNGAVMLSGFAKSADERSKAEALARQVKGVTAVKNAIVVRS